MSRFHRAIHNVASGYLGLSATVLFALTSVPLALHFLDKERFALWALMSSVSGYFSLIDLGMSNSVARLLIDHKDDVKGGTYGSLVLTGWLVLLVQGLVLLGACFALAPLLASLLNITPDLRSEFIALMCWQGVVLALGFLLRIFGHLLFAHQRLDIFNYGQIGALLLNLLLLWVFFAAHQGVFSLVWASLLSSLGSGLALGCACLKLHLFPPRGCWGRPTWQRFQELFGYGKDLFLVALGTQLILASQMLIITRRLGLEQAAVWAVGTKAFNMVMQLVWRIYDASGPGFGEMLVRGEQERLLHRYRTVVVLSASFAAFCAGAYALCNSLFVGLWTAGKNPVVWPPLNDVLLGVWLLLSAVVHCHNTFILMTKAVRFMRYIYFVEGALFVLAALGVAHLGLWTIILCSVLCSLCLTCAYGIWRVARLFNLPFKEVAWDWSRPAWAFLWRFAPVAGLTWMLTRSLPAIPHLAVHVLVAAGAGGFILVRYGIPPTLQHELIQRLPQPAGRLLGLFRFHLE